MPIIGPTNSNASRLRRDATDCEQTIWKALRNRQLEGFKFRRQASIGPYIVDFLCAEYRLIIELDGGQHNEEADRDRTAHLEAARYALRRFWNHEVVENREGVIEAIRLHLVATRGATEKPSPNPFPRGRRLKTMNYLLIGFGTLVLFIGLKWNVTAIHNGGISRGEAPLLFWSIMALSALGIFSGIALKIAGK